MVNADFHKAFRSPKKFWFLTSPIFPISFKLSNQITISCSFFILPKIDSLVRSPPHLGTDIPCFPALPGHLEASSQDLQTSWYSSSLLFHAIQQLEPREKEASHETEQNCSLFLTWHLRFAYVTSPSPPHLVGVLGYITVSYSHYILAFMSIYLSSSFLDNMLLSSVHSVH